MMKSGIGAAKTMLGLKSVLSVALLTFYLLTIAGITIVPLLGFVFLIFWVSFSRKYAPLFSVAASIILLLFVFLVTVYFGRLTTFGVDVQASTVFGLSGLVLIWSVPISTNTIWIQLKDFWKSGLLFALIPAVLSGLTLWVMGFLSGSPKIAWVMSGDAQTNTVLAREVLSNHGESLGKTATFTQDVLALAMSIGREGVPDSQLLIHDLTKISEAWSLMILISSVLMGLIAWGLLSRVRHIVLVNCVVVLAAIYPLSWYVNGFAIMFGFLNVSLSTLLLSLTWLIWQQGSSAKIMGAGLQLFLSVLFLATWPPLVVIPLGFAAGMLAQSWRKKFSRVDIAVISIAALSFVVFAAVAIAPSLMNSGGGLQLDGSILDYRWTTFLLVVCLAFIAAFSAMETYKQSNNISWGLLIFAGSSSMGLAVLLWGNRKLESIWIYYPIKFAWVSGAFLLIISILVLSSFVLSREKVMSVIIGLTGTFGILASFMLMNSVPRWQVLPLARVAIGVDPNEQMLPFVSQWAGTKSIFSHFKSTDEDISANQWLYHMAVEKITDPIRDLAFHPPKTLSEICSALVTLGPTATLITSDPEWANSIENQCDTPGGFTIEVQKAN